MEKLDVKDLEEKFEILNTNSSFNINILSNSTDDTIDIGYSLAKYLQKGMVISLNGELGSGKTVVISGVAKYFGIDRDVSSPTFMVVNEYDIKRDYPLYHFDVYRIKDSTEFLDDIGTDYFYNGICMIEWADEIIPDILPKNTIHIDILKDEKDENTRLFKIWRNN